MLEKRRQCDATLLGAITSQPKREAQDALPPFLKEQNIDYVSPIIQLRQKLDLYANLRPCFNIKGGINDFNFAVIRENTEGLYAGFDYHPIPSELYPLLEAHPRWKNQTFSDISASLRLQSKQGLLRLFHFAFDYAASNGHQRVTFADKPNVLRQSSAFARECFEAVASAFPEIKADILNVDAVALWLVRRPEEFGVIVAENMFGDILSDLGAGVMGGLGFAPSANMGMKGAYFEPVHGSAPRILAKTANPSAMFLTCAMLLRHLGFDEEARRIQAGVQQVVTTSKHVTYDIGGSASTEEMAQAIIDAAINLSKPKTRLNINLLEAFTSSEISDALDGLGIESVLLGIKPLSLGQKLIGPAYTVKYQAYESKPDDFKTAGNYIDHVPKDAVILIDNDGREDCTTWGDILTQVALHKGIRGTVIHGACRDVDEISHLNYPVFTKAVTMRSGKNRVYKAFEQVELQIGSVLIRPGDIIFADDCGVLVIPKEKVDGVIQKAKNIKETEEAILKAVKEGMGLEQARQMYRYDKPWLSVEEKLS